MNQPIRLTYRRLPMPHSQRGTMLIIALIVLVAMTLAGIATMRSVDTATIMAGNIAFRQSALNAADQGIQAGYALLQTPSPLSKLDNDGDQWNPPVVGYFSSAPAVEPDWMNPNAWLGAATLNGGTADAAGNVVSFVIHRLCSLANTKVTGAGQQCGSTLSTAALTREGEDNFRLSGGEFTSQPQPHYRITARAVGPRQSVAVVQILAR
jgi:type IV pilus assembly protein PilX